jgi:hypothetical protein
MYPPHFQFIVTYTSRTSRRGSPLIVNPYATSAFTRRQLYEGLGDLRNASICCFEYQANPLHETETVTLVRYIYALTFSL